jgi:hypothetical protein
MKEGRWVKEEKPEASKIAAFRPAATATNPRKSCSCCPQVKVISERVISAAAAAKGHVAQQSAIQQKCLTSALPLNRLPPTAAAVGWQVSLFFRDLRNTEENCQPILGCMEAKS